MLRATWSRTGIQTYDDTNQAMQFAMILSGLGPVIRALIPIRKGLRSKVVGILADKPITTDLREVVDFVGICGLARAS